MMSDKTKKVYSEVYAFLNIVSEEDRNKIPKKLKEMIEEEREKEYTNYMKEQKELPTFRRKKFASFHNSYVAYHFKKANCDGYVNLMRFMLSMLGVKSFNVHCHDKRSKFLASNHSILRVECDNKWYYCNPKYTPEDPKEMFMGSIEDLEKYYDFNIYESLISNGENYGDDSNALIRKKTL